MVRDKGEVVADQVLLVLDNALEGSEQLLVGSGVV